MKVKNKITLILLIVIFPFQLFAQKEYYKKLFDDSFPMEHSVDRNQTTIYGECTEEMEGLLLMYEATSDVKYLQVFVQYAKNVIDKRDDLRGDIPEEAPNSVSMPYYPVYGPYPQIRNFLGEISPTWSSNHYNIIMDSGSSYPNQYDNYLILYPLIKFYNIIKNDSALQSVNVNSAETDAMYHYQYMQPVRNFNYVADQFLVRVIQTINYYDLPDLQLWLPDVGVYREFNFTSTLYNGAARYPSHILPMNMQATIGRTLLELYKATNETIYLNKVRAIGMYIKSKTSINSVLNSKSWHYWGGSDPDVINGITVKPLREDVPHSSLTALFPLECYKGGITLADGSNELLFNQTDILQYANTFTKDIYQTALILKEGVTNNDTDPLNVFDFKKNLNLTTNTFPDKNLYLYEYWIVYSEIDPNIYQMLNDFNTSIYYQSANNGRSSYIKNHKTLAFLVKYD